jgi:TetR/AcrR family transcriptional regulator, cholesterol catabolism regulator
VSSTATDRRAEILEAAARCFDKAGYHSSTIDDIAAVVGVSKPTVYYYFKSKDAILYEIHNEMIDLILSRHEAREREGQASRGAALHGLMLDVIELMETHPGHLRIFFEHHRELSEEYKPTIRAKRERFRRMVADTLEQGVAAGEFRPMDVEMTTLAVLGMANWTYQWLRPGGARTAAETADEFWRFTMRAISVEPPA